MRHSFHLTTFLALLLCGTSFAYIIESGDGGDAFAANLSEKKCSESDVSAVYVCSGNVVKVVSSSEDGYIFYKPDGRVIRCRLVTPSIMGAECVQYLSPDPCFFESVCGNVSAKQPEFNLSSTSPSSEGLPEKEVQDQPEKVKKLTDAPENSKTKVAIAPKAAKKLSLDYFSSLSDNSKLLLGIIICGFAMFILTTIIFFRSH